MISSHGYNKLQIGYDPEFSDLPTFGQSQKSARPKTSLPPVLTLIKLISQLITHKIPMY